MGAETSKANEEEQARQNRRREEQRLKMEEELRTMRALAEAETRAKLSALEMRTKWQQEQITKQKIQEEQLRKQMEEMQIAQAAKEEQLRYAAWQIQHASVTPVYQSPSPLQQAIVAEPSAPLMSAPKPARQRSKSQSRATVKQTLNDKISQSNIQWREWTAADYISETHNISRTAAENLVILFKENNTIPFISHYKRDMTMGMDFNALKNIKMSYETVNIIKQKGNDYVREFDKRGLWTPQLHVYLQSTKSLEDLEHVKLAFKGHLRNSAEKALSHGLGVVVEAAIAGATIPPLECLIKSNVKDLQNEKAVKDRIIYILADKINRDVSTLEEIKKLRNLYPPNITTTKIESLAKNKGPNVAPLNKTKNQNNYEAYEKFSCCVKILSPHQVMEINQGQAKKLLYVRIEIPNDFKKAFSVYCKKQYEAFCNSSTLHHQLFMDAVDHLWEKSLKGFIATQTRDELTKKAEITLVDEFAENIKNLLLVPPVKDQVVIGIEPGIKDGCKLVVLTKDQQVLETETIFPFTEDDPKSTQKAERTLAGIVLVHKCSILALGNGPARRKVELFISDFIKKISLDSRKIGYMLVEMYGIETCKLQASKEFPTTDAAFLPALCIAKRLLDPLNEWVQIGTRSLCQYKQQYNLPENILMQAVNDTMTEAVSSVGVDINTASFSLLERVAGLDEKKARSIIAWRESSGPFIQRTDLQKVSGISVKVYQQCAGFIRVFPDSVIAENPNVDKNSFNYLDQTAIHPNLYPVAEDFLKKINFRSSNIGMKNFIFAVKIAAGQLEELAKELNCNVHNVRLIVDALLQEKGYDTRGTMNEAVIRSSIKTWEDLSQGLILAGIVRGISNLGAFVDIGAEVDGLLHKTNMQVGLRGKKLRIGQCIEIKVTQFNKDRRRIGLAFVKCL